MISHDGERAADDAATRRAIEAVWRIESARLIAGLARVTGDIGLAEDLAQDALVIALEQWPRTGIPPNPAGWLMTTAKNRGIDAHRRRAVHQRKLDVIGRDIVDGVQTRSRRSSTTPSTITSVTTCSG